MASAGTYVVRPKFGSMRACGIYIAGLHNESIRVDISRVDVTCQSRGVVAVSDLFCSSAIDSSKEKTANLRSLFIRVFPNENS